MQMPECNTEFTRRLVQVLVQMESSPQTLAWGRNLQYFMAMTQGMCPEKFNPSSRGEVEVLARFRLEPEPDSAPFELCVMILLCDTWVKWGLPQKCPAGHWNNLVDATRCVPCNSRVTPWPSMSQIFAGSASFKQVPEHR